MEMQQKPREILENKFFFSFLYTSFNSEMDEYYAGSCPIIVTRNNMSIYLLILLLKDEAGKLSTILCIYMIVYERIIPYDYI